mgnify:CR=1 FL=1
MADNFVSNPGSGGSTFAADDISSVLHPRVKVEWGADGVASDAAVAAPLPVQGTIESNQMSTAGTIVTPKYAALALSAAYMRASKARSSKRCAQAPTATRHSTASAGLWTPPSFMASKSTSDCFARR